MDGIGGGCFGWIIIVVILRSFQPDVSIAAAKAS